MKPIFFINIKRNIETAIMFPFVLLGKLIALLKPLEAEYDYFLFFPSYCIGGAEKVNGNIVDALSDKKIIIFFTRDPKDGGLLHLFEKPNVTIKRIYKWTDNKYIYWANLIYRGICAQYINRQKKQAVVFNGQCNFAYKLFPHLKSNIKKVELIHNSNLQFAKVTFPYIKYISTRITISEILRQDIYKFYDNIGLETSYKNKLQVITNCVPLPPKQTKKRSNNLKVYYVGRGGYQKRLEAMFEIIRQCKAQQLAIDFYLAGSFEAELPSDIQKDIHWLGSISDENKIYELHHSMDVLLLTSRFEGFPMAIMEAMSCSVAIVSTAVDGITEHLKHGINGLLVTEHTNDEAVINTSVAYLKELQNNRTLLEEISNANYNYAAAHFSKEAFVAAYRAILL